MSLIKNSLSVVIATLGHKQLKRNIDQINSGTVVPDEIILIVPKSVSHRVSKLCTGNVWCVQTDFPGQVSQRALGFLNASNAFVLQLDDDVFLDTACIERLLGAIRGLGLKTAVGPSFLNSSNFESIYKRRESLKFFENIYYLLLHGFGPIKPGSILRSGLNIGWDPTDSESKILRVDWLAGGCILHRKENLVLENFYPFSGKAYCEDLLHSHILLTRGISLFVNASATCIIDPPLDVNSGLWSYMKNLFLDYRARKLFVKNSSLNLVRMNLYYFLLLLRHSTRCIRRRIEVLASN